MDTSPAVVGIDKTGRVVTAIAGTLLAKDQREVAKWVNDGLIVRRTTVEHVRKVLGKQWQDEAPAAVQHSQWRDGDDRVHA